MAVEFVVVIPARYASTRLPGKVLVDIGGRPMIQWVHERAAASAADEVIVATDDERIARACAQFGARAELTSVDHQSGTDRIAEIAERASWPDERIVVNVQGDEPLLPSALVTQVAEVLGSDSNAEMATLVTPLKSPEDWADPNVAKVVTDRDGRALYFSRAPIPFPRDGGVPDALRHIGIYAYRIGALKTLAATPPCAIELSEHLEQLRALWLGFTIRVEAACEVPPGSVDTPEDLEVVRRRVGRVSSA